MGGGGLTSAQGIGRGQGRHLPESHTKERDGRGLAFLPVPCSTSDAREAQAAGDKAWRQLDQWVNAWRGRMLVRKDVARAAGGTSWWQARSDH